MELGILVGTILFIVVLLAFVPDPKDDSNDYNGKDKQP